MSYRFTSLVDVWSVLWAVSRREVVWACAFVVLALPFALSLEEPGPEALWAVGAYVGVGAVYAAWATVALGRLCAADVTLAVEPGFGTMMVASHVCLAVVAGCLVLWVLFPGVVGCVLGVGFVCGILWLLGFRG